MRNISGLLFFLILMTLESCGPTENPSYLPENWLSVDYACDGKRYLNKENITIMKEELLAKSQDRVMQVLGKPDRYELYVRSQKFYIYYLEPGPECEDGQESPLCLFVRMDALGRAKSFEIRNL